MDRELRILILEDVPADAELEEHELKKSGMVFISKIVDTREAFQKAIEEFSPDIILSDYDLPTFDGLAALRIAQEKCPDVPFILVTGKVGEEFAIETLKKGATDYVMKSNLKRLAPSVQRALEEAKQIAERKQAEKKLRETINLVGSIANNLRGGMVYQVCLCKDGSRRFTYVSEAVVTLYGCTPQEAIANPDLIYGKVHPDDKLRVLQEEEEANKALSTFRTEVRMLCPSGAIRWSSFISNPSTMEDGSTFWDGIEFDITDRKKSEELLLSSEKTFRSIVESLPVGMFLYQLHDDGRLIFTNANPAADKILGVDCSHFIGKTIEEAFPPLAKTEIPEMYRRVASTGTPWNTEEISYVYGKIEGAYEVTAFQLSSNNVGVLFSDITERKQAEGEIQKRVKELEDFYDMAISRELRMIELKEKIEELKEELEKFKKYQNP